MLIDCDSLVRPKALLILMKILKFRSSYRKPEKIKIEFDTPTKLQDNSNCYLPSKPRPFFDINLTGLFFPIIYYKESQTMSPFDLLESSIQQEDKLYNLLTAPDENFFTQIIEKIMKDLGIKEESNIIKSSVPGASKKSIIK